MGTLIFILFLFIRAFIFHCGRYLEDKKYGRMILWWYLQPYILPFILSVALLLEYTRIVKYSYWEYIFFCGLIFEIAMWLVRRHGIKRISKN